MAKEKEDSIDVEEVVSKTESFLIENQKKLSIVLGAVLGIVAIYMLYTVFYADPREEDAGQAIWKAEEYFFMDSLDLALQGDGQYPGFFDIIDNYGGTKAANLSNYYVGVIYMKSGQYEAALDYLGAFNGGDNMVGPTAIGLMGDAHYQLGQPEKAVEYYLKAAGQSKNELTAPRFLKKAGDVFTELNRQEDALKAYERIKYDYPQSSEAQEIDRNIARVSAS
ncbi:MAG: tol-pal system YbgF family protein [Salibacteraceae bacterium]